jgi:hypothetical protein
VLTGPSGPSKGEREKKKKGSKIPRNVWPSPDSSLNLTSPDFAGCLTPREGTFFLRSLIPLTTRVTIYIVQVSRRRNARLSRTVSPTSDRRVGCLSHRLVNQTNAADRERGHATLLFDVVGSWRVSGAPSRAKQSQGRRAVLDVEPIRSGSMYPILGVEGSRVEAVVPLATSQTGTC